MHSVNYNSRIKGAYDRATRMSINRKSKIVIMSDCHRGAGGWNDNFVNNEKIYYAALNCYYKNDYTYIELGDGDELWETRNYCKIIRNYSNIYWLLSKFHQEKRLYMLYGNHDMVKKNADFTKRYLEEYYCDAEERCLPLFPGIQIVESMILEDVDHQKELFLLHGHQGECINDQLWFLGRWMVRYLWKPLEVLGVNNPMEPESIYTRDRKHINKLEKWANENQQLTIGGHTHHSKYPKKETDFYYNSGSCVHPRCITAIEIECGELRLVKWCIEVNENQYFVVKRIVLEDDYKGRGSHVSAL
ncbi:metallophosphoesterase [Lachnospiraceae bacterium LCP25S3_G4]